MLPICRDWPGHRCAARLSHPVPTIRAVESRVARRTVADRSGIEWTETTWNPTTGCDQTSPGCDNCYALALAKRLKAMGQPKYRNDGDPRTSGPGFALTLHEDTLAIPHTWRSPRLVFVNSMSDLFHPDVPLDFIRRVFEVMADTPQHTYQILIRMGSMPAEIGHLDRRCVRRSRRSAVRRGALSRTAGPIPGRYHRRGPAHGQLARRLAGSDGRLCRCSSPLGGDRVPRVRSRTREEGSRCGRQSRGHSPGRSSA